MDLPRESVDRVARLVVGDSQAELLTWTLERVGGGTAQEIGMSGGIGRVRGSAVSHGQHMAWSAIVKALHPGPVRIGDVDVARHDPHAMEYWRREADAYGSGLLDDLGGDLAAPRCLGIVEEDAGVLLWLEDVRDEQVGPWSIERLGLAARHLGRWNAESLVGDMPEPAPWFSRGRVREWLRTGGSAIPKMRRPRRPGILATWLSDGLVARIERLYLEQDRLLAALESLPRSLCHHDAHRRNLLARRTSGRDGPEQTVAIDWQVMGPGHLGEEIATLIAVSLWYLDVPARDAARLERAVVEGYTTGLRDRGWVGLDEDVRLGCRISASLTHGIGGAGLWFNGLSADPGGDPTAERVIGHPGQAIGEQWGMVQSFLLDMGEDALRTVAPGLI